mmetsp:Transcript_15588/g.17805  ORF Transcript_15588/g.17805 Transcript_15588/m.17805 type:complete len:190 (-) Transcript_15588:257-826(-)
MNTYNMISTLLSLLCTFTFYSYASSSSSSSSFASRTKLPFTLGIRDSIMIAHSFHDNPAFGPAGNLHGATYTCDIEFSAKSIHPTHNWVLDIGQASTIIKRVLKQYNYKNLDDIFVKDDAGNPIMTTTEFMARQIYLDILKALKEDCVEFGDEKLDNNSDNDDDDVIHGRIKVKLWESHDAWASYEDEF